MMKRMLIALMAVLPMLASAQQLAKKGRNADEIVPQGTDCVKAEGDLNKDGRSDLVIYAQPVLAIYFANASGVYEQWKQYDEILPVDEEGDDFWIDLIITITDRGVLRFYVGSFASGGTSYNSNNTYLYRFQNGDFYKIGEEQHSQSRMTGEAETVSINYLTHKRQVVKENVFDDTVKPKETWTTLAKQPLRKLGEDYMNY